MTEKEGDFNIPRACVGCTLEGMEAVGCSQFNRPEILSLTDSELMQLPCSNAHEDTNKISGVSFSGRNTKGPSKPDVAPGRAIRGVRPNFSK